MEKRTIIGIDPGTNLLGFGVIEIDGGRPAFVDMGVLDLRKEKDAYSKLRQIFDTVSEVVRTYHGTEMALESPFYGKNVQVVLKLGRAQGAAMIAARSLRPCGFPSDLIPLGVVVVSAYCGVAELRWIPVFM